MQTLDTIFTHRSIRDFKDEKLDCEQLDILYKVLLLLLLQPVLSPVR